MTKISVICVTSVLLLSTTVFANSTTQVGQADAQVLAQSLLPAAQTAAGRGSDTQLLRWLGISATPVGGGSTEEGTNMGVSGIRRAHFQFATAPHCALGYPQHTMGLSGTPIHYICSAAKTTSIQLSVCMRALQFLPCSAGDYQTMQLPLTNHRVTALGATWWGHCDSQGRCHGGMQVSEQTVTNSDDLTRDADTAALHSPIYHTLKVGYNHVVTSEMQQIASGDDIVNFKACAAGVTDTIINGIYHSCDAQNEGTFSGCKKVMQCTHYQTTEQKNVSTKTCQLTARPQQKACTKTLHVTLQQPPPVTVTLTVNALAYTRNYKTPEIFSINLQTGQLLQSSGGAYRRAIVQGHLPAHMRCKGTQVNDVGGINWTPPHVSPIDTQATLVIIQQPNCNNQFVANFQITPTQWYSYQSKALIYHVTYLPKPTAVDSWQSHCDGEV